MADYTYAPAPVLIESTGEFAIGVVGALTDVEGTAVQVYDLNDSPLGGILVGPKGAHQAFKADIPHGILDFGSVLLPTASLEQQEAGFAAVTTANTALTNAISAVSTAGTAVTTAQQALSYAQEGPVAAIEAAGDVEPVGTWNFLITPSINGDPIGEVAATTSVAGVVELATNTEAQVGTDTSRAITPSGLKSVADTKAAVTHFHNPTTDMTSTGTPSSTTFLRGDNTWAAPTGVTAPSASETVQGIIELATSAEVQTGTDTVRAVTPAGLAARTATDTRTGVVELATSAEALTGTDTARAVTPAGVKAVGDTKLGIVSGSGLLDIHKVTQAAYDALGAGRPASRVYVIVG
jgi:hypothetical protein